jgi:exodeoxyribonuclease VII small subunit
VTQTSGNASSSRKADYGDGPGSEKRSASEKRSDSEKRPGYEQARDELTELVRRLEAGGLTLEQSLQLWERGEQLATICEEWLEGARARMATALARREEGDDSTAAPF